MWGWNQMVEIEIYHYLPQNKFPLSWLWVTLKTTSMIDWLRISIDLLHVSISLVNWHTPTCQTDSPPMIWKYIHLWTFCVHFLQYFSKPNEVKSLCVSRIIFSIMQGESEIDCLLNILAWSTWHTYVKLMYTSYVMKNHILFNNMIV